MLMNIICFLVVLFFWDFSCSKDSDSLGSKTSTEESLFVSELDSIQKSVYGDYQSDKAFIGDNCPTSGGKANETGLKTWCWEDITIPTGETTGRDSFSNGELALNIQCTPNQVYKEGNRLKFVLNPTNPSAASWCPENFNMRSEIRTMPWNVDHPSGTEEWIGFNYGFGDNYIADPTNNWVFYQAHEGTLGASPLLSLQIDGREASSYETGEIVIVNASQMGSKNSIYGTNIVPKAGENVDVVIHVIWGDDNTGLLEVWLNGIKTLDLQKTRTVRISSQVGGNSKFGIYKHTWRSEAGVQSSASKGVTQVETSMGPLRMITRKFGDTRYRQNSYAEVSPE